MAQATSPTTESVQFSRTQGVFSAVALGGSVILGVNIFVGGGQMVSMFGSRAPLAFVIAAILFLPLLLSSVQRGSGTASHAGFYGGARASGSALRLFFTVWVMLGGYLALGALLAYGTAMRANVGLERVFGVKLGMEPVVLLVVTAAFAREILIRGENWRNRTAVFWTCTVVLLVLAVCGAFVRLKAGTPIPTPEPPQHWLLAVSMLASSLWSIDIVLSYRGQLRYPNRTTTWSLLIIFFGGNLLGALISMEILLNPSLLIQNWLAVLTWNEGRLELLLLVVGLLICLSGLLRVMARMTRLLGAMILDGAIPSSKTHQGEGRTSQSFYIALFSALLAYCTAKLSTSYLLLISGFAALLSLVLYFNPLVRKDASRVSQLTLPLHPLIPLLAVALSIFLMWILPIQNLFTGGVWLLAGAVLYWSHSRKRMLPALQQQQILAAEGVTPTAAGYRVLACLTEGEINESLIRIGAWVAAARDGELLVLRILETSEALPSNLQRQQGEIEWKRIDAALQEIRLPGRAAVPVVRMAPDSISGIQATAKEYDADFVLVEWPAEAVERLRKNQLQSLLQLTAKPLGIFKGRISGKPAHLSVGCGSSTHTIQALQTGEAIASMSESEMETLRVFTKSESETSVSDAVQTTIRKSGVRLSTHSTLQQDMDIEEGILKQAEDSDLLILGASDDPLSGRPLPDGLSMEIALEREQATLIVKSQEESSSFLIRRALAQLTNRVAALTPKERSELLANLKVGLQARADFYFMVALAASIAIIGLIMNDGSIVLGAMLVSPLMSPIVGIACGIALGNPDLIRRSSASTFKGMGLVLGMGVVMTFLLPTVQPTDQILSRTHPGILDLLAALAAGAAGAYSLGKKTVAGALPGVAMSLSLEPPLATAGYGLSTSQFWISGGAFLLFLTNLAAIVLSGVGVYILLGMRPPRKKGLYIVGKAVVAVILTTLVLSVPLGLGTYGSIQKGHLKYQIEAQFRREAVSQRFELLDLKISENEQGFLIHPTVLAQEEVTPERLEKFRRVIEQKTGSPIQMEVTILRTTRMESPPSK